MCQAGVTVDRAGLLEAVEQAADGIVITDTCGNIQFVNPAFTAMTGYSSDEAVGQSPRILKSGCQTAEFYTNLWNAIRSGQTWNGEVVNRRKDGSFYTEEMRIAPVRDRNGILTGYIAIKRDTTERRAHEKSQALLAAIVESSDDAIIATTTAGVIVAWNPGANSLFGYSPDEVVGNNVSMLMASGRLDELKYFTSQILEGINVSQYESVCLRKDGSPLYVSVTGTPQKSSTGEVVSMSAILRDITPRHEAESKLRESEGRFREVFECAPVGIYVAGPDERFVQVNEAYCRMVGYGEKELLAKTWVELCVTEDQSVALWSKNQQWKDGTRRTETERRYIHRNGTIVWCKVKISFLRAADGSPLCSVIHVEDVTERRRVENALQESEERFRTMADGCPTPLWVTDAEGGIQFTNRMFREFCGNTQEQVEGRKWQLLIHPDDLPEFMRETDRALRTQTTFKGEARIRRADGEWRWLMSQTEPRFSPDGEFLGHVGLSADITERKRAEEALRSSEKMLRGITDSANDAILMMDTRGLITYWNPAAESIFGYTHEEAIGQNLHILLVSEHDRAAHLTAFPEFLRNGRGNAVGRTVELKGRCKSGREIVIELSMSAISLSDQWHAIGIIRDVTERKEAEQVLRNSEEKFRQLAENILEVFWMMNAAGTEMLYVGPAYERIWGRSCKSLYQRPMDWMDAIHIDDRARAHEQFMRQLHGESIDSEYRICTPGGQEKWIRDRAFPVRDESGELIRIAGIAEDITERRQSEILLTRAADRLMLATRAGGVGIWENDLVGRVLVWDEQMFRLYGITKDAFCGAYEAWLAGLHPEDRQRMNEQKEAAIRGEKEFDGEFRVVWPDGSIHHIRALALVMRDGAGKAISIVGTNWDITAQKQAAEALRGSEEKFRQLSENIHEVFFVMTPLGTEVLYISPAFEEVWERSLESIYRNPMSWVEAIHPDDREQADLLAARQLQGELVVMEYRIRTPDGKEKWIRARCSPIHDETGALIRIVGIAEEITEQKRYEAKLVLARQGAEAANLAKSEFLANMSHEIRTPMNGVIGMTGLLLDTDLTKEQRHYANTVRDSGESLLQLINNILDLSKIEAKKLELETEAFDLHTLLDKLASTLALQANVKGLELISIADPAVPAPFLGDSGRLRQILTNLVGNAIKFTEKGEVAVHATLLEEGEADCLLRFSVRDTGIGIPEDKISVLFNKFVQVDTSTTRKFSGTGLGLAISKQLVEMMGGSIGVTSQEGKGSEFYFTARLGRGNECGVANSEAQSSAALNGIRVLIVDDNAASREILGTLTAGWGMRATGVEGGPWALQALYEARDEDDPFLIAIIDMQMPGMDGEALGRAIRADERLAALRMVMLTSLGVRDGSQSHKHFGFSGYATKPVRRDELLALLANALSTASGSSSDSVKCPAVMPPAANREAVDSFARKNVRILLAEDNSTNREVALGILGKLGLRADSVADGAEAVTALGLVPYDLVLMDMRMPVMDGIEATRQIRNPKSAVLNHDIPVIAMTANVMQRDRECCIGAGMNDFVTKPVSLNLLRQALKRWLPVSTGEIATMAQQPARLPSVADGLVTFDHAGMLQRLEGNSGLATRVIGAFLEDMPCRVQALKKLVESGDAAGAGLQAHSMKGAAANVGGEALRAVAYAMEMAADAGDLGAVKDAVPVLEAKLFELERTIREEWNEGKN